MTFQLILLLLWHAHQDEWQQGSLDTVHTSSDKVACNKHGKGITGFVCTLKVQESPWKLQSILESPWISVLTLSNPDSVPNTKDLQDKIAHVVVELNSRHFLHWMESLKNGKCVLESPWIFCSKKKGTKPGINFGRIWHNIKSYMEPKTLFTWSGGPRSSGVGFFCFVSLRAWKQKKPTPLDRGPPLHVNRP